MPDTRLDSPLTMAQARAVWAEAVEQEAAKLDFPGYMFFGVPSLALGPTLLESHAALARFVREAIDKLNTLAADGVAQEGKLYAQLVQAFTAKPGELP